MEQEEGLIDFDMFAPYHLSISTWCVDEEQLKADLIQYIWYNIHGNYCVKGADDGE